MRLCLCVALALLEMSNCDYMKRCQRQSDLRVQVIMVISAESFLCNKTLYEKSKVKNHSYIVWRGKEGASLCLRACVYMKEILIPQFYSLEVWLHFVENVDCLLPLFDRLCFL